MAEEGEPFGRDAVLADPDLDRIAGHEADRDEGQEHQRQERRDRQRDAAEEVSKHGLSEDVGLRPSERRSRSRPYWMSTPSNACVPSGLCL